MREYMQNKATGEPYKRSTAKAISASADAFSYLVMSGTAARDFFDVLT